MQPEQLEIFAAVAKYKSFSEAARRLYISHSTTSRVISALEKELEAELFVRDNHIYSLTAAGEVLLEETEKILECERRARERVRAAAKGTQDNKTPET